MSARPEELLEEALARIGAGATDVEAFLAEHPADATELRPLLEAAIAVRASVAAQPDPNFARLARARFAARVQQAQQAGARRRWWQGWTLALRPVAVAAVTVVLLGTVAAGSVAAAQEALPGEPLYGVKRAQENVQLIMVRDDLDRATLRAKLAELRLRELRRLDERRAAQHGDELAQEVAEHMRAVAIAVEQDRQNGGRLSPETRAKVARLALQLRESALHDPTLLQTLAARIPPQRRPFLARILRAAQEEYERTLTIVEPSEPGDEQPPDIPVQRPRPERSRSDGGAEPPERPTLPSRTPPALRQAL